MATIEICDVCLTRDGVKRHSLPCGKVNNGIDCDTDVQIMDLCSECEARILWSTIASLIANQDLGIVSEARFKLNKAFFEVFKKMATKHEEQRKK